MNCNLTKLERENGIICRDLSCEACKSILGNIIYNPGNIHSPFPVIKKTVLITGGTGSWGHELVRKIINDDSIEEIRIYSRGELAQVTMKRTFNNNPKLKFIIGDVRSYNRLNESTKDVNIVYHLAALKHVPVCEENPWENVNTNIIGVENIIRTSINNNVELVVDVSTDKACNPLNTYGASKSVGEKLIIQANKRSKDTRFVCIRAGNVIGSNGSVIPFFVDKAKNKRPLTITSYEMTRYFMTLGEAVGLVLRAADKCKGGEIFVTKMPAANIVDVANVIWNKYQKPIDNMEDSDKYFPEIGVRPGEKIHEMLVSEHEALYAVEDDNFRIILPMDASLDEDYIEYLKMTDKEYTSNDKLMTEKQIKEMLEESGYL